MKRFSFSKLLCSSLATVLAATMAFSASAAVVYGDATQDGIVNAADLTRLARHVGGIETLSGTGLTVCCLSGTNTAGAADLTKLARYTARISTELLPEDDGSGLILVDSDPDKNSNMVVDYDDLLS